ncbi:MAG: hemerythrin family protein [Bryobacteraceae bacterium]|jgi:hemerythrin
MRPFKWTKANACFVPKIDDEHRAIYHDADELQRSLTAAAPEFAILEILHRLIATTEDHLLYEEGLMRSTRYEAYDWHRQQHDTLRKRLRQFVPLIEDGDRQAALTLVEFLSKWLKDHTALADRMLGAHLRNQDRLHAA